MIMKAYTDINQSKKLTEILPLESADMHYSTWTILDGEFIVSPNQGSTIENLQEDYGNQIIPCWSLAALLQVLPLRIYDELDDRDYELKIDMADKMPRYVRLGDLYHDDFPYDFEKDTLLDNVVESIIWLNDNNYF